MRANYCYKDHGLHKRDGSIRPTRKIDGACIPCSNSETLDVIQAEAHRVALLRKN